MRLVNIYRARRDGRPEVALKAADERLAELEVEIEEARSPSWKEMWLQLMHIKGECYLDLATYTAAEEIFSSIINRYDDPVGWSNRGFARWAKGELERAKEDYVRALTIPMISDENKEIAFRQLAEICLDMGDPGEADAFLHCARRFGSNEELYEEIQKKIETARSRGFG